MRNPEYVLCTRVVVNRKIDEVFDFFAAAENLEVITPPELRFRITSATPVTIRQGTLIDYKLSLFGLGFTWRTAITLWNPPYEFVDTQIKGPYAQWIHEHTFEQRAGVTLIRDRVRYRLPLWPVGEVAAPVVRRQLDRIFTYRQRAVRAALTGAPGPG